MPFEFSVLLRSPSPLKCTKRHSKLRRSTATTSMTRWSLPLRWKRDSLFRRLPRWPDDRWATHDSKSLHSILRLAVSTTSNRGTYTAEYRGQARAQFDTKAQGDQWMLANFPNYGKERERAQKRRDSPRGATVGEWM